MKILLNVVLDLNKDGAGVTHFTEVARSLKKTGNEILALCPGFYPNRKKDWGFRIVYVPTFRKNLLAMLFYELLNAFYLFFWVIKFKPDIVYCRYNVASVFPPLVTKMFNKPYFVEVNGITENELRQRKFPEWIISLVRITEIINFKFAKKVICVTEGVKRVIKERFRIPDDRLKVVENGADPEFFSPMDRDECRSRIKLPKDKFIVGFIGSLAPWRGLKYLVDASVMIKNSYPALYKNLLILIGGEGEEKENLLTLISKNELDIYKFSGYINYQEVPYYMNSFDVCISPFEGKGDTSALGSPLKIFEYMACGRPIIATDMDGVNTLYNSKDFILFIPPMNPVKIAEMINFCFKNREIIEEMGEKAREVFLQGYTWESTAKKVLNIFQESIRRK
ncbi:glycosyltransferase family 4 protein, partial [Patescibacteria group bacterium]|nr:glycosyltransferase family 4 protein [Patescibacteria group bacterium]